MKGKTWADNNNLNYDDITEFMRAACCVLDSLENIDFGLLEDGGEVKKELTSDAISVLQKGLQSILSIP